MSDAKRDVDWKGIGTAIGAAAALMGGAFAAFQSGGAERSATQATQGAQRIALTQEMLDKARQRATRIEEHIGVDERRIVELEKRVAVLEAKEANR